MGVGIEAAMLSDVVENEEFQLNLLKLLCLPPPPAPFLSLAERP